jgi:adenylate cyclase
MNKSIAVLPFVNMSSSEDAEYFSDGITEEIINALVKIKELKVTSRTSAFFYKKKNIPMTEIGEQLNVSTILEGGVRLSGENIRITAQLIQTKDDFHFWSETWDRKLDDIFKIQDEVALAIAEKTREYVDQIETDEAQESVNSSISSSELYKKGKSNFYKENPSFNFLSNDARDNVSYSGFKTKGTIYSHEQSSKSKMPLGISEESSRKKKALI